MRQKLYGICLVLLALCITPAAHAQDCTSAQGDPLLIGAVFPSGDLFSLTNGQSFAGAEAMRQAINACGGVAERPIEWQYEAAFDRTEAEAAVARLADAGIPLIVGSGSPSVSIGAALQAEARGVLYWEMTEPLEYAQAEGDADQWVYSPRPTAYQLGTAAGLFVQEALDIEDSHTALIYEERTLAQQVRQGVLSALTPALELHYDEQLYDAFTLASQIRDEQIKVVILAAFNSDGNHLWYGLRNADANIDAWLHIGGDGYRRDLCLRFMNIEAFMSIGPSAPISQAYHAALPDHIYDRYMQVYEEMYGEAPSPQSDLSASGVYLLLRYILPAVEGDFTPENVRTALLSFNIPEAVGLLGEGLRFNAESGINQAASALVRQQQAEEFCTVHPFNLATCSSPIQPFPTWRERAIAQERDFPQCQAD